MPPGKEVVKRPSHPPVPVERQRRRESEAIVPRSFRSARRNRHLTVPLAVPPACWTCALVMHSVPHGWGLTLVGTGIAAAWTWGRAPGRWDRNEKWWRDEVLYARASAAAAFGWLSLAAWLGPLDSDAGSIAFGSSLLALSAAWGFPWWRHKRPRGQRRRQKALARWDGWWQHYCASWGLSGSRVVEAAESGVTIRLRIQLWAGHQTVDDVKAVLRRVESALDGMVDHGMVRVAKVERKPSQAEIFIKREDPLEREVTWDQALAPRSVHEMALDGLTETGNWKHTSMRVNAWVLGKTRMGKSNHLLVRLAQLSGCADDRQVIIDLKGGRSARPALETGCAEYVITTVDEARMYLRMAIAEIKARAVHCYTGDEQLLATEEVPAVHTLIDETYGLTSAPAGDAECARHLATLASQGSGLEWYVEVYTQYGALEESVQTEQTRMNLALRVVYAVEAADHGSYAIADYANHDASRLRQKGVHLIKDGPEALTEQVRAPKMEHSLFREIASANVRRLGDRRPLRLYCGGEVAIPGDPEQGIPDVTWQQWWDGRWGRLDPRFGPFSPQYQEQADGQAGAAGAPPRPAAPAARAVTPEAAEVAAGIAAEADAYEDAPDGPLPKGSPRLADVLAAQREALCDALMAAPGGISPAQLAAECGMSESTVYVKLGRLTAAGALTKVQRGLWAAVPGKDVHAALDAVEARDAALKTEARAVARRSRIHAA